MKSTRDSIEVFHLLFLRQLEKELARNLYSLKGGCNLRFFFHSIRYSEDIDLDVATVAKDTLRKKVSRLLKSTSFQSVLTAQGIAIDAISEAKQTETTQRWKIALKVAGSTLAIPTKIEFSRRQLDSEIAFEPIDSQIIRLHGLYPILTNHYLAKAALRQKISALIHRTETQSRDIFDLKLLFDLGKEYRPASDFSKADLEQAVQNSMTISFGDFKSQVVSYLMDDYVEYYSQDEVWHRLQDDVASFLLSDTK